MQQASEGRKPIVIDSRKHPDGLSVKIPQGATFKYVSLADGMLLMTVLPSTPIAESGESCHNQQ